MQEYNIKCFTDIDTKLMEKRISMKKQVDRVWEDIVHLLGGVSTSYSNPCYTICIPS